MNTGATPTRGRKRAWTRKLEGFDLSLTGFGEVARRAAR
jgi:hypothetical protein